jgi:hypothetical protein
MFAMLFAVGLLEILGITVLIVLGALAVIWLINRRAAKDILRAGRAQVGKLGDAARNIDPKASLDQEIKDKESELSGAIDSLEESKAMTKELGDQVAQNRREVAILDARIKNSLRDDPDDTKGKAGEYAMQLKVAQDNLEKNSAQSVLAQTNHANNLARFRAAQKKVKNAKQRAKQIGVELRQSATDAKLAKMSAAFNVDIGDLEDSVAAAEEACRHQIAKNYAKGEVQAELGNDVLADIEEEERLQKADAAAALDGYRSKMGLSPVEKKD